ncbi:hypothetical protein MKW92_013914, partial [Papaver armeniacum]
VSDESCNVTEGDVDGNCSKFSKDCLGVESDSEMVNGYCEKFEYHETGEIFSDGIENYNRRRAKDWNDIWHKI